MTDTQAEPAPSGAIGDGRRERLRSALHAAAHALPGQPPLGFFVHHNTLHAFEHLPFEEAVVEAAARLGTEPYETEEAFAAHVASGRITGADIDAVVAEAGASDAPLFAAGPGERALRATRLRHPLPRIDGAALRFLWRDGEGLTRFHPSVPESTRVTLRVSAGVALGRPASAAESLAAMHELLLPHAPLRPRPEVGPRPRDRMLAKTGVDLDAWIRPLLIRACAAFVDQGVAYWRMPGREAGLLSAFVRVYGAPGPQPPEPWRHGLAQRLRRVASGGVDAERVAIDALDGLAVDESEWPEVIEASLRALPGWAGMIAQLQARPDRAPVEAPAAQLVDYLALALLLEQQAVAHLSREAEQAQPAAEEDEEDRRDLSVVHDAFVLAQHMGLGPAELQTPGAARAFVGAVAAFDDVARRRCWHLAYERNHRNGVLDALLAHQYAGVPTRPRPAAQALFCIDEREESLRRHIEELDESVETFGYAGFFGVAMAYQGVDDVRPTPLCPVTIRPRHLVREFAAAEAGGEGRRRLGALRNGARVGSQTAARGVVGSILGLAAVVPLIARCLFPRSAEQLGHAAHALAFPQPTTRLSILRGDGEGEAAAADGVLLPGFTVGEGADIVASLLRTCGLVGRLAPLVVVVGHGSSSLNNPHEAAHDCGATGGGRGGPNARALSVLANDQQVRACLSARGIELGETRFVGGYHNTCDDAVSYYDTDLVPEAHLPALEAFRETMERARRLDAHERCRRFESAPLSLSPERALAHVEARAVDLGEPRPEYGHATNALCIVGRRECTRGLFLDRRAFLVSYDPSDDPDGDVLGPLLASVGPVGAGINLEYYFSFVDPVGYGSGTKLPHNITGLLGVMDGHASDLRTGLPWQMVEIHEPVRLLTIIEAEPALLERLLEGDAGLRALVLGRWIQVVAWSPSTGRMHYFSPAGFVEHERGDGAIPRAPTSAVYYTGKRGHLACARIEAGVLAEAS